jgi:hypothetical protein
MVLVASDVKTRKRRWMRDNDDDDRITDGGSEGSVLEVGGLLRWDRPRLEPFWRTEGGSVQCAEIHTGNQGSHTKLSWVMLGG